MNQAPKKEMSIQKFENTFTKIVLPFGFCIVSKGKVKELISEDEKKFTFYLKKGGHYIVYITDVTSSLHFQLQRPLTTGDKIV